MAKYLKFVSCFMAFLIVMLPICFADSINTDENGNIVYTEYDNLYREYNSLNQLYRIYNGTNATDGILLQEYIHHPMEERIWIKKNYNSSGDVYETFYYLSREFVVKVNNTGEFNYTYVYLDGSLLAQDDGKNVYYILSDHIGSSQVVTDSNGNMIENNSYTPYGEIIDGGDSVNRLYEGKEYDSVVGDYDFGFRKYLSYIRIWGQPDSLLPNVYDPQQLNRYMFERGNPWKNIDPDGHSWEFFSVLIAVAFLIFLVFSSDTTVVFNEAEEDAKSTLWWKDPNLVSTEDIDANPAAQVSTEERKRDVQFGEKLRVEEDFNGNTCERCYIELKINDEGQIVEVLFNSKGQVVDIRTIGARAGDGSGLSEIARKFCEDHDCTYEEGEEEEENTPPVPEEECTDCDDSAS